MWCWVWWLAGVLPRLWPRQRREGVWLRVLATGCVVDAGPAGLGMEPVCWAQLPQFISEVGMTQAQEWGMGGGKAVGPKPQSPGPPAMGLGVVTAPCALGGAVGGCGVGEALPGLGCWGSSHSPSLAVPLGVSDSASPCRVPPWCWEFTYCPHSHGQAGTLEPVWPEPGEGAQRSQDSAPPKGQAGGEPLALGSGVGRLQIPKAEGPDLGGAQGDLRARDGSAPPALGQLPLPASISALGEWGHSGAHHICGSWLWPLGV